MIMDEGDDLPEPGDVLEDQNPADWSDDTRVEVVEVLPNTRCEESWTDETVATANPSYDVDEPVVRGKYLGSETVYAFPASRLD